MILAEVTSSGCTVYVFAREQCPASCHCSMGIKMACIAFVLNATEHQLLGCLPLLKKHACSSVTVCYFALIKFVGYVVVWRLI